MRIIASVQPKRGSSRGLVHYIAHSKVDVEREPEKGRELFNSFADSLSVGSANNSIKMGIDSARPSNDELHHLVLSFRPDDYRALGRDAKARRRGLKEATRAAMSRLENQLGADRLSWAAAVHLNTENPHVHVALQKHYFTTEIETRILPKIPREALPHYDLREGEKVLLRGFLIAAATEKMDHLIDRSRDRTPTPENDEIRHRSESDVQRNSTHERDILRRGFLAEHELHRIDSKINELIQNGGKMRFVVTDPESGLRRRLSLHDIEQRKLGSDTEPNSPAEKQIRTILFKMLAKEETAKASHQSETKGTIREANRIKERYRRNDWKLPAPSFTKDELDHLQDHYLRASNLRTFSYLESVRSELERSGEIGPRDKQAFGRIAARKTISELRERAYAKSYRDFSDKRYHHRVEIGDKRISLAQLDREENAAKDPTSSFVEKLKDAASRLSGRVRGSSVGPTPENDWLRSEILGKLDAQAAVIKRGLRTEHKTVKVLEKILKDEPGTSPIRPYYSAEELAEIDPLALRLKVQPVYEENRDRQRALIGSAGNDCPAHRRLLRIDPSADFEGYKRSVVAGRALAREIVARVELGKAKDDLESFTESKRLQKFAIEDKKSGAIEFVSLHDVDLPRRRSILDRAVDELFESREHRRLRRTVTARVNAREQRLKDDLDAAKGILASASREASEFTQFSFFGLRGEPVYRPIFTSSEITAIEARASGTPSGREAARLRNIIESTAGQPSRSLKEILRDFEDSRAIRADGRERNREVVRTPDRIEAIVPEHPEDRVRTANKCKEPQLHGNSR